jgi:C1A family cysteine protease
LFFNYDYIDFSFSQITQIDLTAMQLLYVIKDIYNPLGKVITMDFDLSKDDRLLAYHSGLNDFLFTKLPENKIQP